MKRIRTAAKRSMGFVLSAALLLGALSGCGKGSKDENNFIDQATKNSKDYVFKMEKVDDIEGTDFSNISVVGDKIYATTYAMDGGINVCSFNADGSDAVVVKITEGDNESHGYMTYDEAGNLYSLLTVYDYGTSGSTDVVPDNSGDASSDEGDTGSDDTSEDAGSAVETVDADSAEDTAGADDDTQVIELSEDDLDLDFGEGMGEYG
jgi:hypothetical protein